METRVAVIAVLVKNPDSVQKLNAILHAYADVIIGRMGLPYKAKQVNIMSIAIDAPQPQIAALTGKIGALPDVSVKTAYADIRIHF